MPDLNFKYVFILALFFSCSNKPSGSIQSESEKKNKFEHISPEIRDSLAQLIKSSSISFPLAQSSALETETNHTLEWILVHGTANDFESLLYKESKVELKAIGIKGLVRNKNKEIYKHLMYSFTQNLNLQYGLTCQKLGGYFLFQLDYSTIDETNPYFSQEELEHLNQLIASRNFGCNYNTN